METFWVYLLLKYSALCQLCKYLTYKEWKRIGNILVIFYFFSNSKYLTYKEWKLLLFYVQWILQPLCKYLTYKEWKHSINILFRINNLSLTVSTLPIRNGNLCTQYLNIRHQTHLTNSKYLTYKEWKPLRFQGQCIF